MFHVEHCRWFQSEDGVKWVEKVAIAGGAKARTRLFERNFV